MVLLKVKLPLHRECLRRRCGTADEAPGQTVDLGRDALEQANETLVSRIAEDREV
jgi:hypothetical protein